MQRKHIPHYMKKTITAVLVFFIAAQLHAQTEQSTGSSYKQAIGLKFPGGFSVTYKKFVTDTHSIEGQLTAWNKGFRLAGLYEFNFYSCN